MSERVEDGGVPGFPGVPAMPPGQWPPGAPPPPAWYWASRLLDWFAFVMIGSVLGWLSHGGGRLGYGLALLVTAAVVGTWQYWFPRDLAVRLTVPAGVTVLGGPVALMPGELDLNENTVFLGGAFGMVAGLVLGERIRRARRPGPTWWRPLPPGR